jgi:hypothetical protein
MRCQTWSAIIGATRYPLQRLLAPSIPVSSSTLFLARYLRVVPFWLPRDYRGSAEVTPMDQGYCRHRRDARAN